MSLVKNKALM
jgi:hypothetical protein